MYENWALKNRNQYLSQGNLLEQVIEQVKYEQNKTYVKVIFNTENFAIPNLGGGGHIGQKEKKPHNQPHMCIMTIYFPLF